MFGRAGAVELEIDSLQYPPISKLSDCVNHTAEQDDYRGSPAKILPTITMPLANRVYCSVYRRRQLGVRGGL